MLKNNTVVRNPSY